MAGRDASFLHPEERAKLLKEMDQVGANRSVRPRKRSTRSVDEGTTNAAVVAVKSAIQKIGPTSDGNGEQQSGCFVCKLDNDHPNLLLCEVCNGEYHTYCLTPKLKAIPRGDWYCGT
jgi:hypothetical protein